MFTSTYRLKFTKYFLFVAVQNYILISRRKSKATNATLQKYFSSLCYFVRVDLFTKYFHDNKQMKGMLSSCIPTNVSYVHFYTIIHWKKVYLISWKKVKMVFGKGEKKTWKFMESRFVGINFFLFILFYYSLPFE